MKPWGSGYATTIGLQSRIYRRSQIHKYGKYRVVYILWYAHRITVKSRVHQRGCWQLCRANGLILRVHLSRRLHQQTRRRATHAGYRLRRRLDWVLTPLVNTFCSPLNVSFSRVWLGRDRYLFLWQIHIVWMVCYQSPGETNPDRR